MAYLVTVVTDARTIWCFAGGVGIELATALAPLNANILAAELLALHFFLGRLCVLIFFVVDESERIGFLL